MKNLDTIVVKAGQVAGGVARVSRDLVSKGRDRADKLALQARLSRLYRQLGALVYTQKKSGSEDEAMISWYVAELDTLKEKLAKYEDDTVISAAAGDGAEKKAEEKEDAMFRGGDGT